MRCNLKPSMPCAIIVGTALLALAIGNPHSTNWLLRCPLHWLTGFQCPFCGGQRAIHELLHLNIREAWNLNLGLLIMSPYIFVLLVGQVFPQLQRCNVIVRFCYRNDIICLSLVLFAIWGVIRNLIP